MLNKLRNSTTGLDVEYTLASGERTRRVYLDSTASTLQLGIVRDVMTKYMPYYANTHTNVHFGAKLSTTEFQWAHDMVLSFVEADPELYTAFYVGSGTTGGINRMARTLKEKRPERNVVITSIMEHHSNDLPHRRNFDEVVHIPTVADSNQLGCIDLARMEQALKEHGDRVNYVAVTGVSNVTGIINPIYDIAELAHRYGTLLLVDAAQMAAHVPIRMSGHDNPARNLDMVVMSGHKIYTPASPGVVVARKDLFEGVEPVEVGGGMVDDVHTNRYLPTTHFPDREEAGTPNIAGAIALSAVLCALQKIGMDFIDEWEEKLIRYAIDRMEQIDDVMIYGETDPRKVRRTGALAFNIRGFDHSLTAAILNDYFNVAVRNACFCAHPYVREMIADELSAHADNLSNEELEALAELHRGMVRASFGLYNDESDVDELVSALRQICSDKDFYLNNYHKNACGDYHHRTFEFDSAPIFSVKDEVSHWFGGDQAM
ncbi:aminotransferase class V-fold PLP-dependent enzyme [Pseudomonadota bacterium]